MGHWRRRRIAHGSAVELLNGPIAGRTGRPRQWETPQLAVDQASIDLHIRPIISPKSFGQLLAGQGFQAGINRALKTGVRCGDGQRVVGRRGA